MRFRATLSGVPGLERPKVEYSNFQAPLDKWASEILAKYPGGSVLIEEMEYREVRVLTGEAV